MIASFLDKEGYSVACEFDGEAGIESVQKNKFDLVILDLMLPKKDGLECLRTIRLHSLVPVIILSAKGSDVDKALGLGFGADDYLSKPFSMTELLARIKALLRRAGYQAESSFNKPQQFGGLSIIPDTYSVVKNDRPIQLTLKEFDILQLLANQRQKVFTKEEIYRRVWKEEYYEDANVINVHIRRLREKIEDDPSSPKYVKTIWGIGYMWGSNHAD